MALQIQGNNGTLIEVGGTTFRAGHVHLKPLEYGVLGHYRAAVRVGTVPSQTANSRLFELRNPHASNLIIPTRMTVTALPIGSVAAPYYFELAMFRCTSFTAVDTSNTVTPTVSPMRSGMAAAPGSALVRSLTLSGASAGMTGGTLTKDASPMAALMAWMAGASATSMPVTREWMRQMDEHPLVCGQDEGFVIENIQLGPAVQNSLFIIIEISWAEVTAY